MALTLLITAPAQWMLSFKNNLGKHGRRRQVRKADLMIQNLPDWQKKDLNLTANDLMPYKQTR